MAGDRVSAELGVAVKANAQNATADAVVISRIVFIVRSNQFEALGVFRTSRPSLIWSPGSEWLTGSFDGSNRSSRWSGLLGVSLRLRCLRSGRRNLRDFRNVECDLVGSIYRGGICTLNFHSTKLSDAVPSSEGTSARSFVRMTNFRYRPIVLQQSKIGRH
jgi:hypothetical protein